MLILSPLYGNTYGILAYGISSKGQKLSSINDYQSYHQVKQVYNICSALFGILLIRSLGNRLSMLVERNKRYSCRGEHATTAVSGHMVHHISASLVALTSRQSSMNSRQDLVL